MTTISRDARSGRDTRGKDEAWAPTTAPRVTTANANASPLLEHFDESFVTPDAVDELDRVILQLAVQGKLVPQYPNDESASELLKRIRAERQEKDPEGFRKPSGSIPNNEPFELPEGWEWVTLGLVSSNIHYGYTASADTTLKEYRMLRITDIQDSRVNWETVPGCDITEQEAKKYLLSDGDILIARTGGTIGKSYLVKNLNLNVVSASYLIRVLLSKQLYGRTRTTDGGAVGGDWVTHRTHHRETTWKNFKANIAFPARGGRHGIMAATLPISLPFAPQTANNISARLSTT